MWSPGLSPEPGLVLPLWNVAMCTVVASGQGTAGKKEISLHPPTLPPRHRHCHRPTGGSRCGFSSYSVLFCFFSKNNLIEVCSTHHTICPFKNVQFIGFIVRVPYLPPQSISNISIKTSPTLPVPHPPFLSSSPPPSGPPSSAFCLYRFVILDIS